MKDQFEESAIGPTFNAGVLIFSSGLVAIPLTASQVGVVQMGVWLVILGIINTFSCTVMLEAAESFGAPESYHALTLNVLGKGWARYLDVSILGEQFFSTCQRLLLLGDFGVAIKRRVITLGYLPNRALIIIFLAFILAFPLSLVKNTRSAQRLSGPAAACLLFGFIVVVWDSIKYMATEGLSDVEYAIWSPSILLAVPIQSFAFTGQAAMIPIYAEMKGRTLAKGKRMVWTAYSVAIVLYIVFGVFGYLRFPGELRGDYYDNFTYESGVIYTITYFFLIPSVLPALSLNIITGRTALEELLFKPRWRSSGLAVRAVAAFLFVATVGVSLITTNLGFFQGIVGGLFGSFTNLVVPGVALLKMIEKESRSQSSDQPEDKTAPSGAQEPFSSDNLAAAGRQSSSFDMPGTGGRRRGMSDIVPSTGSKRRGSLDILTIIGRRTGSSDDLSTGGRHRSSSDNLSRGGRHRSSSDRSSTGRRSSSDKPVEAEPMLDEEQFVEAEDFSFRDLPLPVAAATGLQHMPSVPVSQGVQRMISQVNRTESSPPPVNDEQKPKQTFRKLCAWFIIIFGVGLGLVTFVGSIVSLSRVGLTHSNQYFR